MYLIKYFTKVLTSNNLQINITKEKQTFSIYKVEYKYFRTVNNLSIFHFEIMVSVPIPEWFLGSGTSSF